MGKKEREKETLLLLQLEEESKNQAIQPNGWGKERVKSNGFIGATVLIVLAVLGLAVISTATGIVTIPWLKLNRQVKMERDIIEKTYDADNALYNYHWFKSQHEEIKATEKKIETAQSNVADFENSAGSRTGWTFEDKSEHSRLVTTLTGLKNYYQTIVGEYNARAKSVDRAVFQDELPTFFSIKPF